jgi:hypothetical protein
MGFVDQNLNILLLQQANGNVQTVCHWLLDKSSAPPSVAGAMAASSTTRR